MQQKSIFQVGMLAILIAISGTVRAGEATITVNGAQVGPTLSPLQHGIFFEEINHAGDGGLYAELLRNRAFMRGAEGWKAVWTGLDTAKPIKPMTGQWNKGEIVLAQRSTETDCRAVGGDVNWDDYTFTCKARKVAGAEGFLILFRVKDAQNFCWWNLGGWGNTKHTIEESLNGSKASIADDVPGRIETGRWYNLRIEVKGNHVRCYLDDHLVHDTHLTPEADGIQTVATREKATGDVLLKVVNLSAAPQTTHIALQGLPDLQPTGTALPLTSALPTDENSFATPRKIVPQTSIVNGVKPQLTYNFPPYSATILRLKPKQ